MAIFEVKDMVAKVKTTPHQTNIDQALLIQDLQTVDEQTSTVDVPDKPHLEAKKKYEECYLLSKKSLERVSPPKEDEEVIIFTLIMTNPLHLQI